MIDGASLSVRNERSPVRERLRTLELENLSGRNQRASRDPIREPVLDHTHSGRGRHPQQLAVELVSAHRIRTPGVGVVGHLVAMAVPQARPAAVW